MQCVAKNCSVTNVYDGIYLTCWLCDGHAHVKCAGFNGRHFDKIASRESGLRWACWKCRDYDVDFYKLFTEAKKGFSILSLDFNSLFAKFKQMEVMFDKFEWPENLLSSPKRKKASGERIVECRNDDIPPTPSFDNLGGMFLSPLPPAPASDSSRKSPDAGTGAIIAPVTVSAADFQSRPNVVPVLSSNSSAKTDYLPESGFVPESILPSGDFAEIVTGQIVPAPLDVLGDDDLIVVPPRKTVFVSRLSADTSVDRLANYIKSHSSNFNDNDCRVLKFNNFQNRDISSFKIIVPEKMFDILVKQSFWPMGVLVREFTHRDRPRRSVPVNLKSSKN